MEKSSPILKQRYGVAVLETGARWNETLIGLLQSIAFAFLHVLCSGIFVDDIIIFKMTLQNMKIHGWNSMFSYICFTKPKYTNISNVLGRM